MQSSAALCAWIINEGSSHRGRAPCATGAALKRRAPIRWLIWRRRHRLSSPLLVLQTRDHVSRRIQIRETCSFRWTRLLLYCDSGGQGVIC